MIDSLRFVCAWNEKSAEIKIPLAEWEAISLNYWDAAPQKENNSGMPKQVARGIVHNDSTIRLNKQRKVLNYSIEIFIKNFSHYFTLFLSVSFSRWKSINYVIAENYLSSAKCFVDRLSARSSWTLTKRLSMTSLAMHS